ncbi:hypothetical protein CDBH8_2055 [Corynebacterium diphtheriae BH8]|nr:hypothetical protein CDBH8_2055 [Corynebacterium diphtheriae BH8]AEX79713.1 hypothetical protein CDHC03_1988 [Corynebacterium diphtheriae HC03]AEX82008.1 hypothetical protein CDHC04_2019 [Corynebacterium diphtheriae HC04]
MPDCVGFVSEKIWDMGSILVLTLAYLVSSK